MFVRRLAFLLGFARDVIDVPYNLAPTSERDDRHPSGCRFRLEVMQQLPHEAQFSPEVGFTH